MRVMRKKTLALIFMSIVGAAVLLIATLAVGFFWDDITEDIADLFGNRVEGEPDRLNSRPNIRQIGSGSDDWRQIVQDSPFQLGERTVQYGEEGCWEDYCYPDATYPTINGSIVMVPLAMQFARQHLRVSEDAAKEFADFYATHNAYLDLFNRNRLAYYPVILSKKSDRSAHSLRPLDLFLGTAPNEKELSLAGRNGITPVMKPICRDAFVFITHKDNPVRSLTLEQLRGIYAGKIKNWKEVGGADEAIQAFQREPGSYSQTGMEDLVMRGTRMASPKTVKLLADTRYDPANAVAEYQNSTASIGYTYRYYIDHLYRDENIQMIAVEGVAPTDENIISGAYPLSVYYYGVIRAGDEQNPGGRFLDWILSAEGQACVKQAGYIPIFSESN